LNADEKQTPRLTGNKARAYLKMGDLKQAEKYFTDKKIINSFLKAREELRDKADIVLLNCFKYKSSKDKNLPGIIIETCKN
jgi:hypothetical protein